MIMKQSINVNGAPAAVGPYVHAVKTGNMIFISGQLGLNPADGTLPDTCIANGLDPRPYACAIFAGCTAAMLTPAASPSIGISFGAGNYKFKEVFFVFLPLWIIYGIAVCLSASFVFPLAG